MTIFRFMSNNEFNKYLNGEKLENHTDYSLSYNTNSKGFCFIDIKEYEPITASFCYYHNSDDVCVIFETNNELNKCWGKYEENGETYTEYCTEEYDKNSFKLIAECHLPQDKNDKWTWKFNNGNIVSEESEYYKNFINSFRQNKQNIEDDSTTIFRFMSVDEIKKYLNNEILENHRDHSLLYDTISKGFSFFKLDDWRYPNVAYHTCESANPDICAIFKTKSKLNETWWKCSNGTEPAYCTEKYSKDNFKLLAICDLQNNKDDNWDWKINDIDNKPEDFDVISHLISQKTR